MSNTQLNRILDLMLAKVSIVEIIGRDVQLTKKGREYVGKCPFHNEKTASFYVNDEKGKYYCFGCGAHGNTISYIMETKGYTFKQAIENLSEISGIKLPEQSDYRKNSINEKVLKQLKEKSVFFSEQLRKNKEVMEYCIKRGLDEEIISKFSIGYCPGNVNSNDLYKFRERLIFPIFNNSGEVIAFGGRALKKGIQPKYINSNESDIFPKKEILYAYNIASKNVSNKNNQPFIVVEGYMDAVIMHKFGFNTTVASMGTAFSSDHLLMLWRYCDEPIICFDGDSPGYKAMLRTAFLAIEYISPGKTLKFCKLPNNDDPDSFLQENSRGKMEDLLQKSLYLIDFIWEHFVDEYESLPNKTPEHIAKWKKENIAKIATINNEELKRLYNNEIKNRMYNIARGGSQQRRVDINIKSVDRKDKNLLREAILLYTVIERPSIMPDVYEKMSRMSFAKPEWDEICRCLLCNDKDMPTDYDEELRDIKNMAKQHCKIDELNDGEVSSFWNDVFENHVFKTDYKNDIRNAKDECKTKINENTWARLKALKLNLLKR